MEMSSGGYTLTDLKKLPFDEYQDLVDEVKEWQRKSQSKGSSWQSQEYQ